MKAGHHTDVAWEKKSMELTFKITFIERILYLVLRDL